MDGVAHLVAGAGRNAQLFAQTFAALDTGLHACGRAVVAGGEYALFLYYDRADLPVGLIAACP